MPRLDCVSMNNNPSNWCSGNLGICLFHTLAGLSLQNRSGCGCAIADLERAFRIYAGLFGAWTPLVCGPVFP